MTTSGWSSQYRTPESSQERADNFSSREQQEIRERMSSLSSTVVDWRIWTLWTRTDLTITQTWLENEQSLHTLEWYLTTLDNLLQIIKDAKKWITKRWLSKAQKENMRVAKIKLNQYEKALKRKRRIILKQRWVEISQNDIHTLQDIREQTAKVKESMKSDTISDDGAYLYSSPEIARKSNRSKDKQIIFNQWFQGVLEDGAVKEIWNGNIEAVNDFFMRVAEWRYTQADYIKYTQNAWILNPHFERCGINVPLAAPSQLPSGRQYQIEQRSVGSVDYSNMDWWETFERGWISWIIDKWLSFCKNMTPWQRNTWKSIGVLWWFAAWIFWLYKFFTNKNMSLLSKAWITAWTIFASQALTWDNPITLFRKLMTWWFSVDELKTTFWNAFWDAVSWVWNSWIESLSSVAPAMYSAMIFNPWTTIWEVQAMTDRFRTNGDEWKTFRRQAVIKLEDNYGQRSAEYFSATFWDNFDEEKWRNWLWSFWVTDWSRTWDVIERYITNAWINSQILNKYLEDNWLKIKEDEVIKEEINEYIREKNENKETIDVDELEAHKEEWFTTNGESQTTQQSESSETQTNQPSQSTETQTSQSNENIADTQNKEKLKQYVDNLSLEESLKNELRTEIQAFYDERSTESKPNPNDFSLKMENNFLILTSHQWEKTEINLQRKTLTWFWSKGTNKYEIKFTRIKDLLNVADLTNNILAICRNKTITSTPPFQYKPRYKWGTWWRWIYFNDSESLLDFDTRVLSGGRWWTMGKIDTLKDHPKEYAEYLSKRYIDNLTTQTH